MYADNTQGDFALLRNTTYTGLENTDSIVSLQEERTSPPMFLIITV